MSKGFLPIGTVVELNNSTIPVMIAGYLAVAPKDPKRVWDYSGFIFPTGISEDDGLFCFDNEQIETVIAYGYRDIQADRFIRQLMANKDEIKKKVEEG